MKKKIISTVLAAAMVLSLAACSSTSATTSADTSAKTEAQAEEASTDETAAAAEENADTPIKIALYAPITGNNAQYGLTYQKTIQALAEKINEEGGVNGREVVVDVYDDKADQKEALNIANLIVSDPDVVGVVGSQTSSPTLAAAPIFEKAGIPMISPNASHGDITPVGKHIFSISCLADFEGGQSAAKMAIDGLQKVAILYSNDDNGVYNNEVWQKIAKENGLDVVAAESFVPGATSDFTPQLSKIKAAGAEGVFLNCGYSDGVLILTQMRQLEMDDVAAYAGSTNYNEAFLEAVGDNAEGFNVCNFFYDGSTDETYLNLEKLIKEKTDISLMSVYVTNSYDAFMLLIDAIREVGTDGDAMADWIGSVQDWPGACGPVTFDETRHPQKHLFWFKVKDGQYVFDSQQY